MALYESILGDYVLAFHIPQIMQTLSERLNLSFRFRRSCSAQIADARNLSLPLLRERSRRHSERACSERENKPAALVHCPPEISGMRFILRG